jgi:SAM-dependent methyltransferase
MASNACETPVEYVEGDALRLPFPDGAFDACHTERVLIHLSEPNQCLQEMRRVVRPGGWVVCVEPDLDGMRIDFPDASIARVIVAGFTETVRNPSMGLQLNRRMADAGLIDRRVWTLTEVERELTDDVSQFLRAGALRLAREGRAEPDAVERGFDWLDRQAAEGRYTSYTSMFVVAGRVPDCQS